MFGVGPQEMVIIGLLVLVIFGPNALPRMARDLGRFVAEARRSIDEFKEELTTSEDDNGDEDEAESKDRPKHREKQYDEEDEHDL